ncbi:hypothetical protein AD006_30920 (plasmid) [Pseudonocardia sp. EC080610-09]|uniref:hypothetical protein n=1 Tax=unclassified Pseudonocardia TaxID=2619320 RepID=UPI000705A179|nr:MULTISPECIES: hypothetical protein [unclassified Pseudonocardia]ALL79613.1 hypothetical protein AD006_30920 [Pseudonocardia sp. EC080610-09]ALL85431.1 hypothetical protein AD017_30315 [Pseudonocardia sp. EC080619-01]
MPGSATAGAGGSLPLGTLADGTPFHVPIGVVNVDGEHARCHLCGHWFRSVGAHLRSHGWDRADYRTAFGLERGQSLEGRATQERRARAFRRRRAHDAAVRAGCETGRRWAASGELTRAAAASARGRRQPEQRRRKTLRSLASVPPGAREAATSRASVARLRATAQRVADDAGYGSIGELVRDRVAAGESLASLSRTAGLHKDWFHRHLRTVDPGAARDVAEHVSGPRPPRHDLALAARIGGSDAVAAFLHRRHLVEHRSVRAIAQEVGMSRHAIQAAMARHGVPRTAHVTLRQQASELAAGVATSHGFTDLDAYLRDRRTAGWTWRRIAEESGRPQTWLRRNAGRDVR